MWTHWFFRQKTNQWLVILGSNVFLSWSLGGIGFVCSPGSQIGKRLGRWLSTANNAFFMSGLGIGGKRVSYLGSIWAIILSQLNLFNYKLTGYYVPNQVCDESKAIEPQSQSPDKTGRDAQGGTQLFLFLFSFDFLSVLHLILWTPSLWRASHCQRPSSLFFPIKLLTMLC